MYVRGAHAELFRALGDTISELQEMKDKVKFSKVRNRIEAGSSLGGANKGQREPLEVDFPPRQAFVELLRLEVKSIEIIISFLSVGHGWKS